MGAQARKLSRLLGTYNVGANLATSDSVHLDHLEGGRIVIGKMRWWVVGVLLTGPEA